MAYDICLMSPEEKRTVILGASKNPERYSNIAVRRLITKGIPVFPIGLQPGSIEGTEILRGKPEVKDIHTISIYLNPTNQREWYGYMLHLNPKRIIFNPGAENEEFAGMALAKGIQVENSCTLVLLSSGQF